jgi:ABC-type uncharacterized transport system fused permease/ATPase subunit
VRNHIPRAASCLDNTDVCTQSEVLDAFEEKSVQSTSTTVHHHDQDIGFGRIQFCWTSQLESSNPSREAFRLHIEDDIIFRTGGFNLIVGPTGSGKTSILMALLGEMHQVSLRPNAWINLPREDGIAHAAQESWVLSDTIKVLHLVMDLP